MWKNVFIEAALLSVIIFGGFYINAHLMIKEIHLNQKNIMIENSNVASRFHISGTGFGANSNKVWANNISGHETSSQNRSSISGHPQKPETLSISGNNKA